MAIKEGKNTVSLGSTPIVNFFCWRSLNVSNIVTEPGRRKAVERQGIYNRGQGTSADDESVDDANTDVGKGWLAIWDA